jgi:ketosteroid isomerase-like protein
VAHERGVLARMAHVYSKAMSSTVEGDNVAIHWIFEMTDKSGKVHRFDEVALQQWRGDKIFRERFFYDRRSRRRERRAHTSAGAEALRFVIC